MRRSYNKFIFVFTFIIIGCLEPLNAQIRFSNVIVEGNSLTQDSTIKGISGLMANKNFKPQDLNSALKKLYQSGLFEKVELNPRNNSLVIKVIENKKIGRLAFEGNKKVKDEELEAIITSRERMPFNKNQVTKDTRLISDYYRFKSRYSATVVPKMIVRDSGLVDLVFEIDEGKILQIGQINFTGNRSFSDSQLIKVIKSKRAGMFSSFFSSDNYTEDNQEIDKFELEKFYKNEGFPDARVVSSIGGLSEDGQSAFLTYSIFEGKRFKIKNVELFSKVKGVDKKIFNKAIKIKIGEYFNKSKIDETIEEIKKISVSNGYPFLTGQVRVNKNFKNQTVSPVFEVVQGPKMFVERINLIGNSHTRDNVIRREFKVEEGDAFDPRMLKRTEEKLKSLGYFENVNINVSRGSNDQNAIVSVRVKEAPTGSLTLGLGYSTDTDVSATFALSEKNFRGAGQGLRLSTSTSKNATSIGFGFDERGFLGRDVLASIDFDYTKSEPKSSGYTANLFSFKPSFGFNLTSDTRLNLTYRYEDLDVTAVGNSIVLQQDLGKSTRSIIDFTLNIDKRNSIIKPTNGYNIRLSSQAAGLGGDARYIKSSAKGKIYKGFFNNNVIFSSEIEGGLLSMGKGYSKIVDRFTLGGRSFRGFQFNGIGPRELVAANNYGLALGGEKYAIARLATSFPLGLPRELGLYGSVFAESGALWSLKHNTSVAGLSDKIALTDMNYRTSIGFAMNWETPIGPLQFNWSRPQRYVAKADGTDIDDLEYFSLNLATRF